MTPTYDDLALANGRLRVIVDALARYIKGDENFASDGAACAYATLSLSFPVSGQWEEVKWLLESGCPDGGTPDEQEDWYRRRDALLEGRK